jgi:transcriptional regulator with XRE-family HTH domain
VLKRPRKTNNKLQINELCRRVDVDYQTLTRTENGEAIQAHKAQKIVNAFSGEC